jgi:arylsulfatase A-like enzyme
MALNRRQFLAGSSALAGTVLLPRWIRGQDSGGKKPNILWITAEDLSPRLACYGDSTAKTPVLDQMAREGVRYTRAFANSPVCAPARFTLALGMYPVCFGEAQDMRARGEVPDAILGYPAYLKQAGYHCTNNGKTDYNSDVEMRWDENQGWGQKNPDAHWRSRKPGQPFFSVFNFGQTHESALRSRPDDVDVPESIQPEPFYPDHEEVREDLAWVYKRIESLDFQVGRILKQLEDDGLADDTIVFFYGDHGGILPWTKRWLYDRGTQVPLIIRFGKNFAHLAPARPGQAVEELVSFVDFAPTVLSLGGAKIPSHMQGRAFLGDSKAPEPDCVHLNRGRMDERYDLMRGVRDRDFLYIRNYWPFIPHGQRMYTPWRIRSTRVWQELHDQGKLTEVQDRFFQAKPYEELYDVRSDPHQIHNLASEAKHGATLEKMRSRADRFALDVVDTGYHRSGVGPWGYRAQRREGTYPLDRILDTAGLAGGAGPDDLVRLQQRLADEDPDVRFWAVCGCRQLGQAAGEVSQALEARLKDEGLMTQVTAAEALYVMGRKKQALAALARHAGDASSPACLWALNAVERLDAGALLKDQIARALETARKNRSTPLNHYVRRLGEYILSKHPAS